MSVDRLCRSVVLATAIAAFAFQPARAWAQQSGASAGAAEAQLEESIATAPVAVDGVALFKVRGISSFPAAERAQAIASRIAAARRTPGLLEEPSPFVRHQALADFAVTYAVCVYTDQPLKMEATYTDRHRNVLDVFNEYGVQIMTPAYEGDPETPKVVPRDQ